MYTTPPGYVAVSSASWRTGSIQTEFETIWTPHTRACALSPPRTQRRQAIWPGLQAVRKRRALRRRNLAGVTPRSDAAGSKAKAPPSKRVTGRPRSLTATCTHRSDRPRRSATSDVDHNRHGSAGASGSSSLATTAAAISSANSGGNWMRSSLTTPAHPTRLVYSSASRRPCSRPFSSGRSWDRTSDLPRVRRESAQALKGKPQ